jgi:CheY-like chemotaxis protein
MLNPLADKAGIRNLQPLVGESAHPFPAPDRRLSQSRPGTQPAVVFTTAYDQYAVKAFEANGTDYLLKPISAEALDRAIAKLERNRSVDPVEYRSMLDRVTAACDRRYADLALSAGNPTPCRAQAATQLPRLQSRRDGGKLHCGNSANGNSPSKTPDF